MGVAAVSPTLTAVGGGVGIGVSRSGALIGEAVSETGLSGGGVPNSLADEVDSVSVSFGTEGGVSTRHISGPGALSEEMGVMGLASVGSDRMGRIGVDDDA